MCSIFFSLFDLVSNQVKELPDLAFTTRMQIKSNKILKASNKIFNAMFFIVLEERYIYISFIIVIIVQSILFKLKYFHFLFL